MKLKILISLAFISCSFYTYGQNAYWVFLGNKCTNDFNPYEYFDAKAIYRREVHNLPIFDSKDLPVCSEYIERLKCSVDSLGYASRWLNAQAIYASPDQIQKIERFDFVEKILPMGRYESPLARVGDTKNTDQLTKRQIQSMEAEFFEENSWQGKGVRIAVFDAGFPGVDNNDAFMHIRERNGIIGTYDFVRKREFVYGYSSHGTNVLSCIAGKNGENKIGLATEAEFLLARTENARSEPLSEEQNWLAAVEWADKNGAQIINSSLAYTYHHYFRQEMNGQVSVVSKAANIAASKGILVINAAGNDGNNRWKIIGTPGDADSVLTVGGIDPITGFHISFSSYGPTADRRLKPNVSGWGEVLAMGKQNLQSVSGTSFASPLVAGFAACVLGNYKEMNCMQLFEEIEKSGHLYPYYDYAHGYGIPKASYFFDKQKKNTPTFAIERDEQQLEVKVLSKDTLDHYMYYHVENALGYLDRYYVVEVKKETPIKLSLDEFHDGEKLRIHYQGVTNTYNF